MPPLNITIPSASAGQTAGDGGGYIDGGYHNLSQGTLDALFAWVAILFFLLGACTTGVCFAGHLLRRLDGTGDGPLSAIGGAIWELCCWPVVQARMFEVRNEHTIQLPSPTAQRSHMGNAGGRQGDRLPLARAGDPGGSAAAGLARHDFSPGAASV